MAFLGSAWAASPADLSSIGKVDGHPAAFTYRRGPVKKLSYRLDGRDESHEVDEHSIISLLSVVHFLPDDYSLAFVSVDLPTPDAPAPPHTYFKSLQLTRPPPAFIHDFSPSGLSCWKLRSSRSAAMLHVLVSEGSGAGHAATVYRNLVRPFYTHMGLREGHGYRTLTTTSAASIAEYVEATLLPAANAGTTQALVLLSGDGGVVDVVNALLHSSHSPLSPAFQKPNIALMPLGTGNALYVSTIARDPRDRTLGMAAIVRGHHQQLPLFRATMSAGTVAVNPTSASSSASTPVSTSTSAASTSTTARPVTVHGAVVFSWGLHAALVGDSDTPAYRAQGAARFKAAAAANLFPAGGGAPHAYRGQVSLRTAGGWRAVPRRTHAYVLATLVAQLEAGFTVSPRSRPLDGVLRVVHFDVARRAAAEGRGTGGDYDGNGDDYDGDGDGGSGFDGGGSGGNGDDQEEYAAQAGGRQAMALMQQAYAGGAHVDDAAVGYEAVAGLRIEFEEAEERWRRVCVDGKIYVVPRGGAVEVEMEARPVVDLVSWERD